MGGRLSVCSTSTLRALRRSFVKIYMHKFLVGANARRFFVFLSFPFRFISYDTG